VLIFPLLDDFLKILSILKSAAVVRNYLILFLSFSKLGLINPKSEKCFNKIPAHLAGIYIPFEIIALFTSFQFRLVQAEQFFL